MKKFIATLLCLAGMSLAPNAYGQEKPHNNIQRVEESFSCPTTFTVGPNEQVIKKLWDIEKNPPGCLKESYDILFAAEVPAIRSTYEKNFIEKMSRPFEYQLVAVILRYPQHLNQLFLVRFVYFHRGMSI